MDKLFEDDIKLFCVDVVLNHFGGLKVKHCTSSKTQTSIKPLFAANPG